MKTFSNEKLRLFLQKVLCLVHFGYCQYCISSATLVAENIYILSKLVSKTFFLNTLAEKMSILFTTSQIFIRVIVFILINFAFVFISNNFFKKNQSSNNIFLCLL